MYGRYMKMAKKGHKHKSSTKKLVCGPVQRPRSGGKEKPELKRQPLSMGYISPQWSVEEGGEGGGGDRGGEEGQTQHRRHTVHEVNQTKRRGSGGGGSDYLSPQGDDGSKTSRRKRKMDTKKRKKDRDEKVKQNERLPSVSSADALRVTGPVDMPDFSGGDRHMAALIVTDESSFLTSSLQVGHFQSLSGSSVSRTRVRRAQSDAHLLGSLGGSEERQNIYCPPERKQFYRNFLKALKYSGITARSRIDTSPPGMPHVARLHSENLALENPYGPMWEQIWLELQAYLRDHTPDAHKEWLFYQAERVDHAVTRINNFELMYSNDPQRSLNPALFAASDRDSYEPIGTPAVASSLPPSFQDDVTVTGEKKPSSETYTQQDSVDSKSGSDSTTSVCHCTKEQFLSQLQIVALEKVSELLTNLEAVEALYPNRKRMGEEHQKYRTQMFKRRVEALTLWEKVTVGLASKLCSLSKWIGSVVVCPGVCYEASRIRADSGRLGKAASSFEANVSMDIPNSPKSPRLKAQFSVGSPEQDDLQQSLTSRSLRRLQSTSVSRTYSSTNSSATLQRFFSNYQAALSGPYRSFVDRGLKIKGLTRLMKILREFIMPELRLSQFALSPPSEEDQSNDVSEGTEEERRPLLAAFLSPALTGS